MKAVVIVKAALALVFFAVVALTLPHPVSLVVGALDLALCPVFVWLAKRWPRATVYALVAQTAVALAPRQFVQGYVNGVNWPIYIALPLIAGYVLRDARAVRRAAVLVLAIALPAMAAAALTLPPGMKSSDALTLIVFIIGLLVACAAVVSDMLPAPHSQSPK